MPFGILIELLLLVFVLLCNPFEPTPFLMGVVLCRLCWCIRMLNELLVHSQQHNIKVVVCIRLAKYYTENCAA